MAEAGVITKRMAISKANAQMVAVVAVASFVTVFCLVASHAVLSQNSYQARVITAKDKANSQLKSNITAYNNLANSYEKFVSTPTNVIGGNPSGSGSKDGDNAKIILDALPSSYDFPALASSLEQLLSGYKITSITGTDDQVNQQTNTTSVNPQPVSMPFTFSISNASYASVGQLITTLQQSIRPIQIDSIDLSGASSDMTMTVNAHTYYQPGKSVSITKQVVK
jgi:hypothetical protein